MVEVLIYVLQDTLKSLLYVIPSWTTSSKKRHVLNFTVKKSYYPFEYKCWELSYSVEIIFSYRFCIKIILQRGWFAEPKIFLARGTPTGSSATTPFLHKNTANWLLLLMLAWHYHSSLSLLSFLLSSHFPFTFHRPHHLTTPLKDVGTLEKMKCELRHCMGLSPPLFSARYNVSLMKFALVFI